MPSQSWTDRVRPHSVPLAMLAVLTAVALVVPPLVLDGPSARTYALTAAVLVLAVGSALPYAVAVAVGTLPLVYLDAGSYASPRATAGEPGSVSPVAALRHVGAGFVYVLAAAMVGAIGVGFDVVSSPGSSTPSPQVPFFLVAGGVVGLVFVGLQLWRHDVPVGDLDARTTLGTVGLGLLLVPAGRVALWVFGGGLPL